jgi:hypothetical protein
LGYALPTLHELREVGRGYIGCDPGIALELHGAVVQAAFDDSSQVGEARLEELERALMEVASRVRRDFVSVCPRLCEHCAFGAWFRGETRAVDWQALGQQGIVRSGSPSAPILLPPVWPQ